MKKFKRSFLAIIGLLAFLSLVTCKREQFTETDLEQYLDSQEEIFEQISVAMGNEYWKLYTEEGTANLAEPKQRFAVLFSDENLNSILNTWYNKRESLKDAVLKRRVELWHNTLTGAKVHYDEEVLKLTNQLESWLAEGNDSEDKPTPDEIEKMVLKLMRLRNDKAKELGFSDYAEMVLEITELGSEWFYSFVAVIDSATLVPYQNLMAKIKSEQEKKDVGISDIRRLMGQYIRNRMAPTVNKERLLPLMKETLENIGVDFDTLPVQLEERKMPPGIGGQGFALHIPTDFRAVVMPEIPLGNRLHELGHGLQWIFTETESPILKGYEWNLGNGNSAFSEGMAETMAGFVRNPEWIKKYTDLKEKEFLDRRKLSEASAPAYLRFLLRTFMFEIELYKDLDQNLQELAHMLNKKYLLIDEPVKRMPPIANMIYVSYPVYIQNYLIAYIISWQVHKTLEKKFGKDYPFNQDVGEFLKKNLWESGELYPWQTRLKKATGRDLDVKGYLKSQVFYSQQ